MNKRLMILLFGIMIFMIVGLESPKEILADTEETAKTVTIGTINYDTLTMNIQKNDNTIVYYSLDKKTWYEVEAACNADDEYVMDISWVSVSSSTSVYFKGNIAKTIVSVVIPAQNTSFKVTFNKADGDFTFENIGDSATFQWRNSTDYTWHTVSYEMDSDSYLEFLTMMDTYRFSTTKIILRTSSKDGYGDDAGFRSSKEATVTITARSSAPSIKVNIKTMVLNTTTSMEYYNTKQGAWVECDKNMTIEELAPESLYENEDVATTVLIRKAATDSNPYSKTAAIIIPAQRQTPVIGDSTKDVTYYYEDGKLVLQFPSASSTNIYEYAISEDGTDLEDVSSITWKAIKASSLKKFSVNSVPNGAVIYVRKAGTTENASKSIALVLPSQYTSFTVNR